MTASHCAHIRPNTSGLGYCTLEPGHEAPAHIDTLGVEWGNIDWSKAV